MLAMLRPRRSHRRAARARSKASTADKALPPLRRAWISRSVRRASSGFEKMSPIFLIATWDADRGEPNRQLRERCKRLERHHEEGGPGRRRRAACAGLPYCCPHLLVSARVDGGAHDAVGCTTSGRGAERSPSGAGTAIEAAAALPHFACTTPPPIGTCAQHPPPLPMGLMSWYTLGHSKVEPLTRNCSQRRKLAPPGVSGACRGAGKAAVLPTSPGSC